MLDTTPATVSRNLSKLEGQLGVPLFDRRPQKLLLTATGEFAAQQAAELLRAQAQFSERVTNFAAKATTLRVGATIPGPLLLLRTLYHQNSLAIDQGVFGPQHLATELLSHHYSLLLSPRRLDDPAIESSLVGHERLAIKVTNLNPLYPRETVTFADLNGHEFVVAPQIGDWRRVIEREAPGAQFIYQLQLDALHEITKHSNFPLFRTNITHNLEGAAPTDRNRKYIPISDPATQLSVYASYLRDDRVAVAPLVDWLREQFARLDEKRLPAES